MVHDVTRVRREAVPVVGVGYIKGDVPLGGGNLHPCASFRARVGHGTRALRVCALRNFSLDLLNRVSWVSPYRRSAMTEPVLSI